MPKTPMAFPLIPAGQREFPLYLTNHQRGVLYIPAEMSKSDYDLLKQQIENHLKIILLTSVKDSEDNARMNQEK
jgi:hypothetical protein